MTGSGSFRRLTIFHYHLLPGGVTDVIILSARALLKHMPSLEKITLVYGRDENIDKVRNRILRNMIPEQTDKLQMDHLPLIDYREKVDLSLTPDRIIDVLKRRYGGQDNLWMIHNYQLGKNPPFTQALISTAQEREQPLLFQIHDFPECSRYANLKALIEGTEGNIYPQTKNTAYCVINARDYNLLREAGIHDENLTLLNNPVPLDRTAQADPDEIKSALYCKYRNRFPALKSGGKLLFYPVRSIRRKNVLEGAFLVNMMEEDLNFMVSLPGVSPQEKAYSDLTERAFTEGLVPGYWGIGADEETELLNYPHYWAASDMILSPSIQEGFGYLYLNALHWGKPLYARYLDIMEGFKSLFDSSSAWFYNSLSVPLTESEKTSLTGEYREKFVLLSEYMPAGRKESLLKEWDSMTGENRICFSYLSPAGQYAMLARLKEDREFARDAAVLNGEHVKAMKDLLRSTVPDRDREIGLTFGEESYARTMEGIMGKLSAGSRESEDSGNIQGKLEETFFALPYLRLLYGDGK